MRCMFPDTCRVFGYQHVFEEETGKTQLVRALCIEKLPCRVSFRRYPAGSEKDGGVALRQGIRLYSPAKIELDAGAEIEFGGRVYKRMGVSAVYPTHRESDFLLEEWA